MGEVLSARSLGVLTLDLIAKIGGFTAGMSEAERVADRKSRDIARKNRERAKEVEKAWSGATRFIAGAFAGLSVAGLFRTFIQESVNAQNEQAQLAAVLKSTGEAAGFSADELNKMAASMAANSTFGEGDITRAQTRLLSYIGIVGDQFPQALQSVIDMATRMGTTVEQSAETVGRALEVPSKGMASLTKAGFKFTEDQKAAAEELERTGRVAEAQAIVLEALESSYGGAAKAARETFGGSVAALQEELRSLMTGSDGSLEGARGAVEDLIATLQSPGVRAGFAALIEGMAKVASFSVDAITGLANFGKFVGETIARGVAGSADPIERLGEQIGGLETKLAGFQKRINSQPSFTQGTEFVKNLKAQAAEIEGQIARAKTLREELIRAANAPAGPGAPKPGGASAPSPAEIARLAAAEAARKEAEKRRLSAQKEAEAAAKQAQSYVENLRRQLEATENLSVAETVLRDIQEGRLKLAGGVSQQQVLDLAKQIDLAKEMEEIEKEFLKLKEDQKKAQEELAEAGRAVYAATRTPIETLNTELANLNDLLAKGAITWDTYGRAVFDAQDKFDAAMSKQKEELSEWDQFMKKAIENTQDALGDGIFKAMRGEFDSLADGFTQMLQRMVAEALAADLAKRMFGSAGGGSGDGWLGAIAGWAAGAFGGGRAAGGAVNPGQMYRVNENGPEVLEMNGRSYLMMGSQAGNVRPNGAGTSVVNNFSVSGPVDRRTEAQIGREASRGVQRAQRWM